MSKEIKVGQKLYHFAYGPLTVISVSERYVETVADLPLGYRGGRENGQSKQVWILDTVGHWLFETQEEVGTENNNFDWKKHWPGYSHEPVLPVMDAMNENNWHPYFKHKAKELSPVGIVDGGEDLSPVGIVGTNPDGDLSPVGVVE